MALAIVTTFTLWFFGAPDTNAQTAEQRREVIPEGFKIQGVSLSQNNGYVDFANLKDNSIDFAYFRATTGNTFMDKAYVESMERAKEDGLATGAIMVFDASVNGNTQAGYFIEEVGDNVGDLPIVVSVDASQMTVESDKDRLINVIQSLGWHYSRDVVIATTPEVQKSLNTRIKETAYWSIANNLDDQNKRNLFIQYNENHVIGNGMRQIVMPTSVYNGGRDEWREMIAEQQSGE
jgi:lysozyme